MILRRLRLRRFLGFADRTFDFAPGINVVVGPNESGKSSLRTAIRAALYGNPSSMSAQVDTYRTWGTDQLPALDLEFEIDGRRYRLSKDYQGHKIYFSGSGETLEQYKRIGERIAEFLGLSSREVFQITAEVAQAELERVQLTSVSKELSRVLGGGADVDDAIKQLAMHVKDMEKGLKGMAREPGELRALEKRVSTLTEQHDRVVADIAQIERTQRELAELQQPLTDLEASLAAKQKLLKTNLETQEFARQLEGLRREEAMLSERVGRIDQSKQELAAIGRDLEAVTAAGMPDEAAIRAGRMAEARITHLESQIAAAQAAPHTVVAAGMGRGALWVGAGLLAALIGAVLMRTSGLIPGIVLVGIGAAAATAGTVRWIRHRATAQSQAAATMEWESRLRALDQEKTSAQHELADVRTSLDGETLNEADRRLQKYRDLVGQREASLRMLEMLRSGTTEDAARDRLDRLRTDIYGLTKELESPDRAAVVLPAFETQKLRDEVEALTRKTAEMSERVKRLAWEVEHRKDQAEDLASVEEQLQEATDGLAAAQHRHLVYKVALDSLLEARRQIERPVRDVVAGRAGDYLRILSGGRYDRIEVEKDSLQVWVWSSDAGGRVEPREPSLSRGTIDLVYLSLRFALVTALAEGRHPPLLLDDPFITFDDTRRAAAAELLKELSRSHQVFLFTCGGRFDADADNVILLPAHPTGGSPVVEPAADAPRAEVPTVGPLWDSRRS
ncbi:MAG TPA: AAA family ATPase [bacterium]|jgi:DNA repair exonuclease SbcCD ATPase subunit